MTFFTKWCPLLNSGICGILLATGCAPTTRHQWLTFFFDGVPNSQGASNPVRLDRPEAQTSNSPTVPTVLPAPSPLLVHRPYGEHNCVACHASDYSQRLKNELSRICTGCHKAFLARAKFSHAPVEDGQCTLCHAPHQAKEKSRLVKDARELCFDCHEPEAVLAIQACAESPSRSCTDCHDPHQENRRFLLRARGEKPPLVRNEPPEK